MPASQRADIERQLKQLPPSFTSAEITLMYRNLRQDAEKLKAEGVPQHVAEQRLHHRHKLLAFAYPALFFKVAKGEMSEYMFATCMGIKQRLDSGDISQAKARELVVDSAKKHIEGAAARPTRAGEATSSQEVVLRARVDTDSEIRVVDEC